MQLHKITIAGGLALALSFSAAFAGSSKPAVSFGTPITEADIAAWDIDIQTATGKGLPSGSGSVAQGKALYEVQCVACHGVDAAGGSVYGSMAGGKRPLTGGGYPYAPILFDYIRTAMSMNAPQSLSNDEGYALTAHIYVLNEFIPQDAVLDAASLTAIQMPARDAFILDDRTDTAATRCMKDC